LAALLPTDRELTVVTNSLPIASILSGRSNVHLHILGGRVRHTTLAAVDSWALGLLRTLTIDMAFLGTNGFSVEHGCTTPDPSESAVKEAMIMAARNRVIMADHSKFGNDQFSKFAELSEIDTVVTEGLDQASIDLIEETGPKVVFA
jgi:DeoR family fructose operon transcriptional repressor